MKKNYLQQFSFITKVTLSGLTSTFGKCEKGMTRTNVTKLTVHNIVFNYVKFLLTKFVHFLKALSITISMRKITRITLEN